MSKPQLDHPAPDFDLPATSEKKIKLSDLKGKHVILYFYPKDATPGCTLEAQAFRNLHNNFLELDAVIIGVSRDQLKSHEKFKCDHQLPYELLSDNHETLCVLYDVIKDKNMYGKKVRGIERSTFLIDKRGILRKEWRKVKVEGHAEEVLTTIKSLIANG